MLALMLPMRSNWVSPGAIDRVGLVCPLTVRCVGALLSMSVGTLPSGPIWMSLSSSTRSRMPASCGIGSSRPSITMPPDRPPITCCSELPCWWLWYQYRPGLCVAGMSTLYSSDLPGSMCTNTLSETVASGLIRGETLSPWKCSLVGAGDRLASCRKSVSPGLSRSTGGTYCPL